MGDTIDLLVEDYYHANKGVCISRKGVKRGFG